MALPIQRQTFIARKSSQTRIAVAANLLADGENVLAVEVRWYGRHFPQAEIHRMPGLWAMLGDTDNPGRILTDENWKVFRTEAYASDPIPAPRPVASYCVVDPCEDVDYRQLPIGWTELDFVDDSWSTAWRLLEAYGRYQRLKHTHWFRELAPRLIPPMEETPKPATGCLEWGTMSLTGDPRRLRSIEGELHAESGEIAAAFWADPAEPLTLAGTGTHYIIINMRELVTGYPRITIDAPGGTMVEFRYAEGLSRDLVKGVRDDPESGTVEGYFDTFTCRSGETVAEPFMWRTWRFIRIAVHHPDGPVTLKRIEAIYTSYPFTQKAAFESPDPLHKQIWDVSWRTARLCAHEHYEDCPYYEQLQYVGDTRLQALISYMVAGDFRLARQALRQWFDTRRPDGVTKSRTPSGPMRSSVCTTPSIATGSASGRTNSPCTHRRFESPGAVRSDCHGWGAWIMCELLTGILGIRPAEPGFATVRIAPILMDLPWARGSMPTVGGTISVDLKRDGDTIRYAVTLPDGVSGVLATPDGAEHAIAAGETRLESKS